MQRFMLTLLLVAVVGADRPAVDSRDPLAKHVIKGMDELISNHVAWNDFTQWSKVQRPFWTDNFTYDTVEGFHGDHTNFSGLRQWYDGEHIPFNNAFWPVIFHQQIFLGERTSATTSTYANVQWIGPLGKLKPGAALKDKVVVRICDFYRVVPDSSSVMGGRISYNWMMIDMVGLLLQAGRRVLPEPRLPEALSMGVHPPNAFDGTPTPDSFFVKGSDTEASWKVAASMLEHEWMHQKGVAPEWAEDMTWYGPVGIGVARNKAEYRSEFIDKIRSAFANVEVTIDVMPCEGHFCGAHGYLHGDHVGEWLGQPATGKRVHLRFGSHWHVRNGIIIEGWTMMDLPDLFKQFGEDLFTRTSPPVVSVTPKAEKPSFDNDCMTHTQLNPPTKDAPQTFLADCPAWVIKSTDAVWHAAHRVNESIEEYFYEDWMSSSDQGVVRGLAALKTMVKNKRDAFPDLKIHITDALCYGNDIDGYKTVMPDILTGTNTGFSDLGPPTNRSVIYRGMATCYVQKVQGRWQYVGEWVLHDGASFTLQMGQQPQIAPSPELHDCKQDFPSWGWRAPGLALTYSSSRKFV